MPAVRGCWASLGQSDRVLMTILRRPMWELLAWGAAILAAIATAAGLFWSPLYRDAPYWTEQARGIDLAAASAR